ncbi:MAG: endonuclease/exonuclease/phosphatase family protein [Cyanobacteria bacterium J06560_6]
MKTVLKWLGLLVGLPTVAIALFYVWASAGTLSKDRYATVTRYDAPAPAVQSSYTIVSYNIGYLSGLANNTLNKPERSFFVNNQQQVIAALGAVKPDIVALQEIDINARRSYEIDQVAALAASLEMSASAIAINWDKQYLPFPYWPPSAHFGKILSGQATISRYPIERNRRIVLERVPDQPFFYNKFYLDRLAQVSQISLDGQPVIVISVHLEAFDEPTRINQTQFVRSLAEDYAQTLPVIVTGDFNSATNRPSFVATTGETHQETQFSIKEMLASEVLKPAAEPDPSQSIWDKAAATFPSDAPEYKLDYMFYTPSTIEVIDTQVLADAAQSSDHLPLMMRFRFK